MTTARSAQFHQPFAEEGRPVIFEKQNIREILLAEDWQVAGKDVAPLDHRFGKRQTNPLRARP